MLNCFAAAASAAWRSGALTNPRNWTRFRRIDTRQVRSFAVPVFFFGGDMLGILPKLVIDAYRVATARSERAWGQARLKPKFGPNGRQKGSCGRLQDQRTPDENGPTPCRSVSIRSGSRQTKTTRLSPARI